MYRIEYAGGSALPDRPQRTFEGLAKQAGVSEAACVWAAEHGRLGTVVRAALLERRHRPRPGAISGAVALARLQEVKGRLLDEELRRVRLL